MPVARGPNQYVLTRRLFLRALGAIHLIAFLSFYFQVDGLVGGHGILPATDYLARVRQALGPDAHYMLELPTLAWLSSSDRFLHFLCLGGAALSVTLMVGFIPIVTCALLWIFYLSLCAIGGVFMNYQWDALLLEASLLSVFFAPPVLRLSRAGAPSTSGLFLMRYLLFRLMLLSGVVKLASGDRAWRDFTALEYHYFTQPLPAWTSYYANALPAWCHRFSAIAMFAIELVAPFLLLFEVIPWLLRLSGVGSPKVAIFARRLRLGAVAGFVSLQLLILGTGNYGFFNWLTLVLCIPLLDDAALLRLLPSRLRPPLPELPARIQSPIARIASTAALTIVACCFLLLETSESFLRITRDTELPDWLDKSVASVQPFRSINSYGLFAVMTTTRPEIIVEGSDDKQTWKPYVFKWKPGPLDRAPEFVAPHQPRLDWQMWFAALGTCRRNGWFLAMSQRLLENDEAVIGLLSQDPFPDSPPKYLRSTLYQYRFTTRAERSASGAVWSRSAEGPYCPTLTLQSGKLTVAD